MIEQAQVTPGRIVILNGTSSSGKTSILHALQELPTEPYLDCGIDKFVWLLPKHYLYHPLWDDERFPTIKKQLNSNELPNALKVIL